MTERNPPDADGHALCKLYGVCGLWLWVYTVYKSARSVVSRIAYDFYIYAQRRTQDGDLAPCVGTPTPYLLLPTRFFSQLHSYSHGK